MFSIIIPTWNNLAYLKLCVESIRRHSQFDHELVVHVNDGSDGTLDWVRAEGIRHSHSTNNVGVCLSANLLAAQATRDWLLYANDDMVFCPGWDVALADAIKSTPTDLAVWSSTLIEPAPPGNPLVIVHDFGQTPETFDEARLLRDFSALRRGDREGAASQPTLLHRTWWHAVGGYSVEFGPGMSSDDDLLMKLWAIGCRHFRVVGASLIYHFSCRSTGRVRRNRGGRTFVMKWGITQGEFKSRYLARLASELPQSTLRGRAKRMAYGLGDYPLGDLRAWDAAPARTLTAPSSSRSGDPPLGPYRVGTGFSPR